MAGVRIAGYRTGNPARAELTQCRITSPPRSAIAGGECAGQATAGCQFGGVAAGEPHAEFFERTPELLADIARVITSRIAGRRMT